MTSNAAPIEMELGSKLRVYLHTGEIYTGIFVQVSLGLDKSHPQEASIMLGDTCHTPQGYGSITIFTCAIKYIMVIERPLYICCSPALFIPLGSRLALEVDNRRYRGVLRDLTLLSNGGNPDVVVLIDVEQPRIDGGYSPMYFMAHKISNIEICIPLEEEG